MLVEAMKEKYEADFRRYCDDAVKNVVTICDTMSDTSYKGFDSELAIIDVVEYVTAQQKAVKKEFYHYECLFEDVSKDTIWEIYADTFKRLRNYEYCVVHRILYKYADDVVKETLAIKF